MTKTLTIGPTNCYLLNVREGYLLIDTSLPECFRQFLEKLKEIRVDPSEIKLLLLTHAHDDHAGFAAELREESGCRIVTHKNSIESLKEGCIIKVGHFLNTRARIMMTLYSLSKRRDFEYTPVTLNERDVVIEGDDEEALKSVGIDGRIIYTPGHTEDGISVITADGDAFVGDVCMSNLGFLHCRPIEVSDLPSVFASWQKIIENGARKIYPGHGKPFAVGDLIRYRNAYTS